MAVNEPSPEGEARRPRFIYVAMLNSKHLFTQVKTMGDSFSF